IGKNGVFGFHDGDPDTAEMFWPEGLVLDPSRQHLYIADTANHAIHRYDFATQHLSTVAGIGGMMGFSDTSYDDAGQLVPAFLNTPREMTLDPGGGSLWFTDTGNDVIRRLDFA